MYKLGTVHTLHSGAAPDQGPQAAHSTGAAATDQGPRAGSHREAARPCRTRASWHDGAGGSMPLRRRATSKGCRAEKLLQAPLQTAKAKAAREPARKLMPGSRPKTDSAQAAQESCRRPRHTVKSVTGLIP